MNVVIHGKRNRHTCLENIVKILDKGEVIHFQDCDNNLVSIFAANFDSIEKIVIELPVTN